MTDLSSSLIIYSFWTHSASKYSVENRLPVRPSRGLEEIIKMDSKCMIIIISSIQPLD